MHALLHACVRIRLYKLYTAEPERIRIITRMRVARITTRMRTSLCMPGAPVAPAAAPNEKGAAAAGAAAAGAPKAEEELAAEVLVREADAGAPQASVFVLFVLVKQVN